MFMDKQEIIDLSENKGFLKDSCGPELCDALASGKPKTKTRIAKVEIEENKCDTAKLVEEASGKIRVDNL